MSKIIISELKPEDMKEAASVCSAAFIQNPFIKKVLPGPEKKQEKFMMMGMTMLISKTPGQKIVAKDGSQIVGVARFVEWPDCQKSTPSGLSAIPGLIFGGKGFRNVLHFRKIWAQHDPKEPHWHLDPLCVLPERQGQGIGSKLLTYYLDIVDKKKMLAYHETDKAINVKLYNKFGFKSRETEKIFGIENWFLYRDAR